MISFNQRRELAREAISKADEVREAYGLIDDEPLSIYELCSSLGLIVRFGEELNPEGMYIPGKPSRILITAYRPASRKVYTCAHELGHHVFNHGKRIDHLVHRPEKTETDPDEFLVESFAGHLLMPTLGIQYAFTKRGWSVNSATPEQLFTIACEFGVGYHTILIHCRYALNLISASQFDVFKKITLPKLQANILGGLSGYSGLVIADAFSQAPLVEVEVGNGILLPLGTTIADDIITRVTDIGQFTLYQAARRGIISSDKADGAVFKTIKVTEYNWQGLDRYRHGIQQ